jgi:L-lysine exporter family protein LysE/ArgO
LICSISDAVLISIGVLGIGSVIASQPVLSTIMTIGGALFLFWYGFRSFRLFLKPKGLEDDVQGPKSLKAAVMTTLAITLLNPHVYLDTVVLLGSISSQYDERGRLLFGAGAVTASFLWFFILSLGGRLLSPIFKNPLAWRIMDLCITVIRAS